MNFSKRQINVVLTFFDMFILSTLSFVITILIRRKLPYLLPFTQTSTSSSTVATAAANGYTTPFLSTAVIVYGLITLKRYLTPPQFVKEKNCSVRPQASNTSIVCPYINSFVITLPIMHSDSRDLCLPSCSRRDLEMEDSSIPLTRVFGSLDLPNVLEQPIVNEIDNEESSESVNNESQDEANLEPPPKKLSISHNNNNTSSDTRHLTTSPSNMIKRTRSGKIYGYLDDTLNNRAIKLRKRKNSNCTN